LSFAFCGEQALNDVEFPRRNRNRRRQIVDNAPVAIAFGG
jgi:hypothetical protein